MPSCDGYSEEVDRSICVSFRCPPILGVHRGKCQLSSNGNGLERSVGPGPTQLLGCLDRLGNATKLSITAGKTKKPRLEKRVVGSESSVIFAHQLEFEVGAFAISRERLSKAAEIEKTVGKANTGCRQGIAG